MNNPISAIAPNPFCANVVANKATTPYGIKPIMKSATQKINVYASSNSFVKIAKSLAPCCFTKRATPPMITPNTTMEITFVCAIAFTGLDGIKARNVSTTGFTSRILESPAAPNVPSPSPVKDPKANPTIAAIPTITSATIPVEDTNRFKFACLSICKITYTIEMKTTGMTNIRIKSINPPPIRENHFVLSLINTTSIGLFGNPAINCTATPKIAPIKVAIITSVPN